MSNIYEYINASQKMIENIENMKLNYSTSYMNMLKSSIATINRLNLENLTHKLPATRKSTSKTAIRNLKIAHKDESLNLVLGAGISSIYGLPNWNNLLQRLLFKTIEEEPQKASVISKVFTKIFNPNPLVAGRYLQETLIDEKIKNKFEKDVRSALYETYDKDVESHIMDEIIKLCVAPGNSPNLDGIITYNYDDVIETKLNEKGVDIPFQSVYGQGINPDNKSLPIYHVHGYLPQKGRINTHNSITLGEFVYHEQYNNTYSWNNIVQINKFRDKVCLFIGISLSDPNIRRLLDIANSQKTKKKYHYILKIRPERSWVEERLRKILDENPEIFNEKVIANIDFDETVSFLMEMQNRFEEKDTESLGVKTVWIDDYDKDISEILKKIRE